VNARDCHAHVSALHLAAYYGSVECVRVLLEAGANVRLVDKQGRSCLHWACRYVICRLLLAGDVSQQRSNGQLAVVQHLVENTRVLVNAMTKQRFTPLDYALQGHHQQIVEVCHIIDSFVVLIE